jgi:TAT (twin-arginine translocation) pathway signal sequence
MDAKIEERGHGVVLDKRRSEISRHMSAGALARNLPSKPPGKLRNAKGARMKRRTFFKGTAVGAAAAAAPAIWSEAKAQARN